VPTASPLDRTGRVLDYDVTNGCQFALIAGDIVRFCGGGGGNFVTAS
jgi:hypothetical protein